MQQHAVKHKQQPRSRTSHAAKRTRSAPRTMHPVLQAQSLIGNHGVLRRYPDLIQPKLKVGAPNDRYEQEADRVAEQVMRMTDPTIARRLGGPPTIQRTCAACASGQGPCPTCAEEEETLQRKPLVETITPLIQRQEDELEEEEEEEILQAKEMPGQALEAGVGLTSRIRVLRGGGRPLPGSARAYFEPRFGYDFSRVRIHTDARAAETARLVNARAFTVGRDVVFGAGEYAPGALQGRRLLAHELTHVVQQAGSRVQRQSNAGQETETRITQRANVSIQTQRVENVRQSELTDFFSQYEDTLPADLAEKYLTNPELMAIQMAVVEDLVARVQASEAPLTANQFLEKVNQRAGDYGTALLVCHNVTKALSRGRSPIPWAKVSEEPLEYTFDGTSITFDPDTFHENADVYGSRGQPTVFYAMFSANQFGIDDEGDWYHYYLEATATYYAASSELEFDATEGGIGGIADQMYDSSITDTGAYRGWRFANALSYVEGVIFGNQSDINRESAIHRQGACAGIVAAGQTPGEDWKWYVPTAGSGLDANGIDVIQDNIEILDACEGIAGETQTPTNEETSEENEPAWITRAIRWVLRG